MKTSTRLSTLLLTILLPFACTADNGDSDDTANGDTEDTATSTATDDPPTTGDPADFYACEEKMFRGSPLAGPGFDAMKGGLQGPLQPGYVLHITEAYLRPDKVEEFYELAGQVGEQAGKTPGLIAFSAGADTDCGVARTIGIWADEEAMYKLVTSEIHGKAMARTAELTHVARVTHWSATAAEANAFTYDIGRAKLADVPAY